MTGFVKLEKPIKRQDKKSELRKNIKKYTNWSYLSIFV